MAKKNHSNNNSLPPFLTEKQWEKMVDEKKVNCGWYPDDCYTCRNCYWDWLEYEWNKSTNRYELV